MSENDISDDYINQLINNLEKIDFDLEFGGGKYGEEIRENREKERAEIEKAKAAEAEIKTMKAEKAKISVFLSNAFYYFSSLSKKTEQDEKNKNFGPQAKK